MGTGKAGRTLLRFQTALRFARRTWLGTRRGARLPGCWFDLCDTFNPCHVTTDVGDVQPQAHGRVGGNVGDLLLVAPRVDQDASSARCRNQTGTLCGRPSGSTVVHHAMRLFFNRLRTCARRRSLISTLLSRSLVCMLGSPYLTGVPLARVPCRDSRGGPDRYGALAASRDRRRRRRCGAWRAVRVVAIRTRRA
jgi:hypothetical protein